MPEPPDLAVVATAMLRRHPPRSTGGALKPPAPRTSRVSGTQGLVHRGTGGRRVREGAGQSSSSSQLAKLRSDSLGLLEADYGGLLRGGCRIGLT